MLLIVSGIKLGAMVLNAAVVDCLSLEDFLCIVGGEGCGSVDWTLGLVCCQHRVNSSVYYLNETNKSAKMLA